MTEQIKQQEENKEWVKEIELAIREKGADSPCPRCGHNDFSILEGIIFNLCDELGGSNTSAPQQFNTIAVFCTNCGYKFEFLPGFLLSNIEPNSRNQNGHHNDR